MQRQMGVWGALILWLASFAQASPSTTFRVQTGNSGQQIFLASPLTEWQADSLKFEEVSKGTYALTIPTPWFAEFPYKLVVDGKWMFDPSNPNREPDGYGGYNSILKTGFREDPMLEPNPKSAPMRKTEISLVDSLGRKRPVTILNPSESVLQTKGHRSVTIYFQDGGDYLKQTYIETLLANLNSLPSMPALTGVFIPPIERMKEYAMNDGYATFLTYTVVKNVEALFPFTGGEAQKRLVIGASMGGLISVYVATKAPQIFGLVASQSGSLWFDNKAVLKFIRPGLNLKLFIENGVFESPRMLEGNRAAVQLAQKAGIPTHYEEYPTTHDWYSWRNRLSQIFRSFFDSSSRRR